MAALIGALRVSLSAETAAFEAGMKRAQRVTEQSANGITRVLNRAKTSLVGFVTAVTAGTLLRAAKDALDYAGSLGEVAQQLGVTTKELQTFRFAAGQNGASVEEADKALGKFSITISKALSGSKQAATAFGAVGVSLDDLKKKSRTEVLGQIADGMKKTGGASANAAAGVAIFGKGFQKIIPTLDQGSAGMSELAQAAEELGVVLSDDQIQNADNTADKLDALWTVLKAQIAGEIADSSGAILDLANTIAALARQAVDAGNKVRDFFATISDPKNSISNRFFKSLGADIYGNFYNPQASVTTKLPPLKRMGAAPGSGAVSQFLAPSGGRAKKGREDHSAQDALRNAFQFDQELRRAQMDVLQATQSLARDYIARTSIGIEILNAEKVAFEAEQQYQVALFALTKGKDGLSAEQSKQLTAEYAKTDALKRQAILDEEQAQKREDIADLIQTDFDVQKDKLQSELQLAETAKEQRAISLQLLDLSYRQERARLEAVIADEKSSEAAKEEARRRLLGLNATYGNDRAAVFQQTRGPMEDYLASLPMTAAKAQEALEHLQVQGLEGLTDAVLALSEGVGSATDALLETLKQFFLGLARLELQKLLGGALGSSGGSGLLGSIFGAAGSLFGGGGFSSSGFASTVSSNSAALGVRMPGFASGGSGIFGGIPGIDRNVISMNGIPMMRVSYGERFNIGNDNHPSSRTMGGNTYMTVNTPDADSFRRSEGQITRSWQRRLR